MFAEQERNWKETRFHRDGELKSFSLKLNQNLLLWPTDYLAWHMQIAGKTKALAMIFQVLVTWQTHWIKTNVKAQCIFNVNIVVQISDVIVEKLLPTTVYLVFAVKIKGIIRMKINPLNKCLSIR